MLEELVKAYHLERNVHLCGFTNTLDKYVAKCRCFVFPSMYEGMPTALLQAMAVGTPCIITDFYSGAREVLGDEKTPSEHISKIFETKWGIMTPVCSGRFYSAEEPLERGEELLAEAMENMLEDDELRKKYSKAGRERSYHFDNGTVIKKWMEII